MYNVYIFSPYISIAILKIIKYIYIYIYIYIYDIQRLQFNYLKFQLFVTSIFIRCYKWYR